jgi:ABC-type lipoprotein export system ATPase subunit
MLSCGNVSKIYATRRGNIAAIEGIDLDIPEGQFVAIVGRSGSGKSSLMGMMGGLSRPTQGEVRIQKTNIWELSADRLAEFRNRKIGFVFQFASLFATMRIIDNVALPALLDRRHDREGAYSRADELLSQVGLAGYTDAYPHEISVGEQRRAAIARALINAPALILADEPTSDLDAQTEIEIMGQFRALHRNRGATLVMVTHSLALAEQADRIVHIANGRMVA